MLRKLLNSIGYRGIDDAVEFVMCGLGILPPLLMLSGFMLAGASALTILLVLLAAVGMHAPPPEPPAEQKLEKKALKDPKDKAAPPGTR